MDILIKSIDAGDKNYTRLVEFLDAANFDWSVQPVLQQADVVGRSEQFYCTCSRTKGLDHDEEGTPYCISCQKEVQ